MKAISLAANERTLTKTTGSKKVRNSGRVPGVLYGEGDPQNIETPIRKNIDFFGFDFII